MNHVTNLVRRSPLSPIARVYQAQELRRVALVGKMATKFQKVIGEDLRLLVQASQEEASNSLADAGMGARKSMRGLVTSNNRASLRSMRDLRSRSMRGFSSKPSTLDQPQSFTLEPLVCMPTAKHVQKWLERNVPQNSHNAIEWRFDDKRERQHNT